ncbi:MAG: recombinase family protein [Acidimicrobiales bacterium]
MTRFALYARTSTDDLQDPADSLRWQAETAQRLVAAQGEIVAVYHDIDKSRSLPWERRAEASRILRQLKDTARGWDALVVAEPQRAFSGTQFEGILLQFAHWGVPLWVPELGGPVDIDNDGHYMCLSNYGAALSATAPASASPMPSGRTPKPAGGWEAGRPTATGSLTPARTRTLRRRRPVPGCTSSRWALKPPRWCGASLTCTSQAPATSK